MADEFVSKEVFDARMDRMEALMEKNLAEYKAIALETRADVRVLTAQIGTLEAHISAMEYWGAIIIGAATIAFGLAQYFRANGRPSPLKFGKRSTNFARPYSLLLTPER